MINFLFCKEILIGVTMIVFDLQCNNNHIFEGWFKDASAFDEQQEKGFVSCPVCNDSSVFKMPSTFGVKKTSEESPIQLIEKKVRPQLTLADVNRKIVNFVKKNFDDVGCNFAKEALKIHYGVNEPRNIRGVSTKEEEKVLKKEGVKILKVSVPEKNNS